MRSDQWIEGSTISLCIFFWLSIFLCCSRHLLLLPWYFHALSRTSAEVLAPTLNLPVTVWSLNSWELDDNTTQSRKVRMCKISSSVGSLRRPLFHSANYPLRGRWTLSLTRYSELIKLLETPLASASLYMLIVIIYTAGGCFPTLTLGLGN